MILLRQGVDSAQVGLATYGGQALGFYKNGETAGFIGSVFGAIVLLVLSRLLSGR